LSWRSDRHALSSAACAAVAIGWNRFTVSQERLKVAGDRFGGVLARFLDVVAVGDAAGQGGYRHDIAALPSYGVRTIV
jgi:hypothetical protein